MIVRGFPLLLATGVLLFAACGGDSDADGRREAVRAVISAGETDSGEALPPVGREYDCMIQGGGPPPGIEVPGACCWDADREGDGWIVSLTESWRCADFRGQDTCTGEKGSHVWRHLVDSQGVVTFLDDSGDFPPEMVY
jgi:hypothetical protein